MSIDNDFISFSLLANASIQNDIPKGSKADRLRSLAASMGTAKLTKMTAAAKMQPFLARLMLSLDVDTDTWQPIYRHYAERNKLVIAQLNRVYAALHDAGCKRVFVSENIGAMLAAGSDTALFASGDVDNYVSPEEYPILKKTLLAMGYQCKERSAGKLFISAEFENAAVLPEGFSFVFEVFPLSRLTQPCAVDANRFVDWSRMRTYADTQITIPPADALMYICLLHISLHSFCRAPAIRLYRDIVNASVGLTKKDWQRVIDWATRDSLKRRLFAAAELSNHLARTALCTEKAPSLRRLKSIVFDNKYGILRPEPSRLRVLKTELACNDRHSVAGLFELLNPNKEWMRSVYGSAGLKGKLKHLRRIV